MDEFYKKVDSHKLWEIHGHDDNYGEPAVIKDMTIERETINFELLQYSEFFRVNFKNVLLKHINFEHAKFYNVNFIDCAITRCNLDHAVFKDCVFENTDLYQIDSRYTKYENVHFKSSRLLYGHFLRTDFISGSFDDKTEIVKSIDFSSCFFGNFSGLPPMVCPEEGSFIAWKKVYEIGIPYIVKLEVPSDARRTSAMSNKCRCEKAKVLEIQNTDGTISDKTRIVNMHMKYTVYEVGEIVYPDSFDPIRWNECSHGIHFFMTREEAVEYN